MLILAVWVLLSFVVAAIWAAEGFGGPLEDAMTAVPRVVRLTWDVRWGWFILTPMLLLLWAAVRVSNFVTLDQDPDPVTLREVMWDLWQVIVLGRRPRL